MNNGLHKHIATSGKVYLLPTVLHDSDKALQAIPPYITDAIKTARYFCRAGENSKKIFQKIWRHSLPGEDIIIDNYEWHAIHKAEDAVKSIFIQNCRKVKNVGIISEAGCPGIADPGQILIEAAQQIGATVIPLVGPSSILMALMASGMNGQCFQFLGYPPIDNAARKRSIKEMETDSSKRNCTQVFIETPYRNNQLLADILNACANETKLCIAVDITSPEEYIKTKRVADWKSNRPLIYIRGLPYFCYMPDSYFSIVGESPDFFSTPLIS